MNYSKDARLKQKKIEKRRKKRNSRKRGYARREQSEYGRYSCIFACAAVVILLVSVAVSYIMRGNGFALIGGLGLIAVISTLIGIKAAFAGLRERDTNHATCKTGLGMNLAFLFVLIIIFIGGLK